MRAIVIAAGRGSRLGSLTDTKPKCMVEIGGKPMLRHAVDTLRAVKIDDITVIRGYLGDRIDLREVRFVDNPFWEKTNIIGSLFCAREEIRGDVLISYSDIIFVKAVVERALASSDPVAPVVDLDWRSAYQGRVNHPVQEAEKVVLDGKGKVRRIGKLNVDDAEASGEFIGMVRLDPAGADRLRSTLSRAERDYQNRSFQTAPNFHRAYLTDLMQEMIANGEVISPVLIHGGWREIDTEEDLERAERWFCKP